ncbi:hypothetical protein SHJG_4052 [Streptomyces hygroscopicus subsp. jinggangensis 5008]|nr:hypothetical protein SHJG_4052 [Streptomyces hygroscopicus subsp. jinggangensis 5008]AGF63482.1 hypothetical protein SHJGH_3817 [Streptomyces hygroscopicus subsp. jinggangensis TL01]
MRLTRCGWVNSRDSVRAGSTHGGGFGLLFNSPVTIEQGSG